MDAGDAIEFLMARSAPGAELPEHPFDLGEKRRAIKAG
jgi:hypothetical protein